jgi:hypothetical protein
VAAPYPPGSIDPERPEIRDALAALSDVVQSTLPVRYARMWLREAAVADNTHDEVRHLAKAERELGRAVLASAEPSTELCRAFHLTMRARHEATD